MQVSGQRPGRRSGPRNRLLCRSAPVLSHYPGAGTARLTDVPDIPVGRFRSSPSCTRWAAGWPCSCLRPGRVAGSTRTIPSRLLFEALAACASLPLGWKTGIAALRRRRAARGSQCSRSGTGSGRAGQYACRGLVMDLSCTRRIAAPAACLHHQAATSAWAAASEVPGRLTQIRREQSGGVPSATSALLADPGPRRR